MKTTELIQAKAHEFHPEPCHDGEGAWYFKDYISEMDKTGAIVQFIHDDILPPHSSFGVHEHPAGGDPMEEWYICLAGQGRMILDGREVPFGEGDISVCRNGGSHGIVNTGDRPLRVIVFCACTRK